MDVTSLVEKRLLQIHRQRSRYAFLPILIIIFASTYIQRTELTKSSNWWYPLAIICLSLIIRSINLEYFSEAWLRGHAWSKRVNFFAMLLQGFGWGYHFCTVYEAYGAGSAHISYALLVIAGMIAGATTSLNASRVSYFTFVSSVTAVATVPYLNSFGVDGQFGLFVLIIFFAYNVSNYRVSHRELFKSVETELVSAYERNRFRKLIDAVPGYVLIMDRTLQYVDANSSFLSFAPNTPGKNVSEFFPELSSFLQEFQLDSKESEILEKSFNLDSTEKWFLLSVRKTEDQGVVLISLPMDELVNAKKELRVQEAKSHYAARLAALGEMAAGIAHEINNPLTIIQGAAHAMERILDDLPLDLATLKDLTHRQLSTSERISKIIKSMKTFARSGDNDPFEPAKLSSIIEECQNLCHQRILQYEIEFNLPQINEKNEAIIYCREVQISQVLINLFNNSIDAVKDQKIKKIIVEFDSDEKWVHVYIRDSGPGIPAEVQLKMMDPFFTTKEVNQGTGLGLSISKAIITEHGGELSFLPEEKMTTFLVKLPLKAHG